MKSTGLLRRLFLGQGRPRDCPVAPFAPVVTSVRLSLQLLRSGSTGCLAARARQYQLLKHAQPALMCSAAQHDGAAGA